MCFSITLAVSKFKRNWTELLCEESINEQCRELGFAWRSRKLNPGKTFHLFLLQVLHGNVALSCVSHLAKMNFTASAFCQARMRLPLKVFELVLKGVSLGIDAEEFGAGDWLGHRVFIADGSGFSMPDTEELQLHFPQSKNQAPGCGFPTAKFLGLIHFQSGMLSELAIGSLLSHDLHHVATINASLKPDDILVGDRAYCSYAHLALLLQSQMHAVMRVSQSRIIRFQSISGAKRTRSSSFQGAPKSNWLRKLGEKDQVVEWHKPYEYPKWMSREQYDSLPDTITIRELEFEIVQKGFRTQKVRIATTLLDPEVYPKSEIVELYRKRWQIEVNFRHLKTTLGMDILHSETYEGIKKELIVFFLIYNLVWLVIAKVAEQKGTMPQEISFKDALRWLRYSAHWKPLEQIARLYPRPNRSEPRAIKRRGKKYTWLTKHRREYKLNVIDSDACRLT